MAKRKKSPKDGVSAAPTTAQSTRARAAERQSVASNAERQVAQETFLAEFKKRGIILRACESAKVGRRTVYDWIDNDPVFKEQYLDAREDATDALEDEARRRAHEGVNEPVYQGGEKVGVIRKYSDRLLEMMMKAHRPDRFREQHVHTGADGGPIVVRKIVTFGGRYKPTKA